MSKIDKINERLAGSIFGACDPRDAAQTLHDSSELVMRIITGQWSYVGRELAKLKAAAPTNNWQVQSNAEIDRLIDFVSTLATNRAHSNPAEFNRNYCGHRAACVLACRKPDCADRPGCWETRGCPPDCD